jgi:lycopene cyclase CruA
VPNTFIKDRTNWLLFNRLALKAARQNPALLAWIWDLAGARDFIRWTGSYLVFTWQSFLGVILGWLPKVGRRMQPWLEPRFPGLWLRLKSLDYALTEGIGRRHN